MKRLGVLLAAVCILVLTGCVASSQARNVKPSGFLGDAAPLLEKGKRGEEALAVYRKAGVKWTSYDKIILDPVAIWSEQTSSIPPEQMADYQKMVDSFHLTLKEKLTKDYKLVDKPGPGAMRIRAAIVNGRRANNTLKVAKIVAPYAGVADLLWTFATGKPAFTGEVSFEYAIRDARSEELLAAGADRRVGGTQLGKQTFTTWGDVQSILTYWSDMTVYWLCVDRGNETCTKPKAGIVESPIK